MTKPMCLKVRFCCLGPGCGKWMLLKGTPERVVEIAKAFEWEVVSKGASGPIPPMACSILCWQRYWLASDDAAMRSAVAQMVAPTKMRDAFRTLPAPKEEPN